MLTFDNIKTLTKFVHDRDVCSRRDIENITKDYLEAPLERRRKVFAQLTAKHVLSLAQGITTFSEYAIFDESLSPVWTALVCMELSASKTDWRENLMSLLVFDHTLEVLKSKGIKIDKSEWKIKSEGTLNNFEQLNKRHASMRNIGSIELKMVRYEDCVKFERIIADEGPSRLSGPFWTSHNNRAPNDQS